MAKHRGAQFNFHENLKRQADVQIGSNRAFGVVMAAASFIIASFGFFAGTSHWPYWLAAAIAFALSAWLRPTILTPLNRLWFRLGLLMHRVVNPLILGLIFFAVITPTGLLLRVFGKRPLELNFQPTARSYWITPDPREPQSRLTPNQY